MLLLLIFWLMLNIQYCVAEWQIGNLTNYEGKPYQNVSYYRNGNYKIVSANKSIDSMYQYKHDPQYVYPFHVTNGEDNGSWMHFRNIKSWQFGWSTKYPNEVGQMCMIMSTFNETQRLVDSFMKRGLTEDNLIFIKIVTYVNNMKFDIRIGNEEYVYGSDLKTLPYPFTFLKGDFERDYKFLPIRLHQFKDLIRLQMDHNIMEDHYEIIQPRNEAINLNISGDCWRNISIFTDHHRISHIGPISSWIKDAIIIHLIQILNRVTVELKVAHGKMWKEHFMNDVCYAEKAEPGRYSVPFHLVRCCSYTKRTMGMSVVPVPIKCKSPEGTFSRIRMGIMITIALVFIFTPLLIYFAPAKPRPYKKLRKRKTLPEVTALESSEASCSKDSVRSMNGCREDRRSKNLPSSQDSFSEIKIEVQEAPGENQALDLPHLVKEGVHFNFDVSDRIYLDSNPEFQLNIHMVVSYLCLCHAKSYKLIILRRLIWTFSSWATIGFGLFFYSYYYPVLLKDPVTSSMVEVISVLIPNSLKGRNNLKSLIFYLVLLPGVITALLFLFLAPILWSKHSIPLTLLQKGDLRFFGDSFPETLVRMSRLHRRPKLGIETPAEVLLTRNMLARLKNLAKTKFWKLWWQKVVCKHNRKILIPLRLPVALIMLLLHTVPLCSVWNNFTRKYCLGIVKRSRNLGEQYGFEKIKTFITILLKIAILLAMLPGIALIYMQVWLLMMIYIQFIVFLTIDVLRNASTTLPTFIILASVVAYIKMAFRNFEDEYRSLKEVVFDLCKAYSGEVLEGQQEESEIILVDPPFEPLYIKTVDGEVSIPRRVFYDVCQAYLPYREQVASTFSRLAVTFFIINVVFIFIVEFQVMGEFSRVGETFLTICTVSLPTLFGMLKSDSHQNLSKRRRIERILAWLSIITTVRNVDMGGKRTPLSRRRTSSSPTTELKLPPYTFSKDV